MNPYDPRSQQFPLGGGGYGSEYLNSHLGGAGGGGGAAQQQQAYMNMAAAQQTNAFLGFTESWNFAEKPKPTGPEQYGPLRPPAPDYGAWRYETSYAPGRENVWMAPLRDPGGRLLKAAAILAAYPAVYLVVLLLRGLLYAIL